MIGIVSQHHREHYEYYTYEKATNTGNSQYGRNCNPNHLRSSTIGSPAVHTGTVKGVHEKRKTDFRAVKSSRQGNLNSVVSPDFSALGALALFKKSFISI